MRTMHLASLIAIAMQPLAGCTSFQKNTAVSGTPEPQTPASPPGLDAQAHAVSALSNAGNYRVVYVPRPAPIPLNEMFELDVEIREAGDTAGALAGIQLVVDAAMPAHEHGMNTRPQVLLDKPGCFTVRGMLFHMPGHWELYFDITRGAFTERAQFDIDLE